MIPYIRGHGFRVVKAITNETQVSLPFKRRNLNHVGTLHACSSATGLELAAGLSVLRAMSPQQIKPVIKSMEIEYFKPGKAVAYARCAYDAEELRSQIGSQSPVVITMHSELADVDGVQLAKMISLWSIKIF
jgi:acyl-coenzyme A thioesterase PaaI-like protein